MKKLLFIAIAIFGFSTMSFAQSTATTKSSATVIQPITISNSVELNFGTLAVSSTIPGTVTIEPSSNRTKTGGVTLPAVTGTVSAAKFTVTGEGTSTYSITLPTTVNLTYNGWVLIANDFTSTPSGIGTLSGGTQDIYVGATLSLGAGQLPGLYTNASDLAVTVNFN